MSKYKVTIKGSNLDVYDILTAYKISNPAIQHAVKKLLKPGQRGYKDIQQDLDEAIDSILRAKELEAPPAVIKDFEDIRRQEQNFKDMRLKDL